MPDNHWNNVSLIVSFHFGRNIETIDLIRTPRFIVVHRNLQQKLNFFFKFLKLRSASIPVKNASIAVFAVAFFPTTLIVVETFHCRKKIHFGGKLKKKAKNLFHYFVIKTADRSFSELEITFLAKFVLIDAIIIVLENLFKNVLPNRRHDE